MFPQFDPSKMDPQVLMQLSQLIQSLPQDRLSKMQTLMHNMMAGFDVRAEMEEFERNLPPGFREKLATLVAANPSAFTTAAGAAPAATGATALNGSSAGHDAEPAAAASDSMDLREARLTILRGVASGKLGPEEAEKLLFS
jgi:hypothetical protein